MKLPKIKSVGLLTIDKVLSKRNYQTLSDNFIYSINLMVKAYNVAVNLYKDYENIIKKKDFDELDLIDYDSFIQHATMHEIIVFKLRKLYKIRVRVVDAKHKDPRCVYVKLNNTRYAFSEIKVELLLK